MPTYFAGIRSTADFGTDERPKEFREAILFENPNGDAPLFALSSKASKAKPLTDPEFAWWYEIMEVPEVIITTTATSTDSTFAASAGSMYRFVPGDVLMVKTAVTTAFSEELVVVSSITSATAMVVKRGQAGSTAAAVNANIRVKKIGNAFAEGTGAPSSVTRNPDKRYNLAQIFKTAVEQTGTDAETKKRTGDSWLNDKKRKMFDHAAAIELSMFFGKRFETTGGANAKPLRFMGGLRENIVDNVTVFATTPTITTTINALGNVFNWNSDSGDQRIVYCGNGFLNSLNNLILAHGATRMNYAGEIKLWGQSLRRLMIPQGEFGIKTHPLFNRDPIWTYCAFVLDMPRVKYRPLRDTDFKDNIQDNDFDGRKGQWLTECSMELEIQETSAFIGNFIV